MSDDVMTPAEAQAMLAQHEARRATWRQTAERDGGFRPDAEVVASMRHEARMARGIIASAVALDALRGIAEGRTSKPTDAEIDAHCATGGRWLMTAGHWNTWLFLSNHQQQAKNMREGVLDAQRWTPLDARGRPCVWPVAAAEGGAP